mmetsp:Transcript_37571/g.72788  ORF Transcript_37571/g.72788 Transcript_37571/m.72788 type:complete len:206 (+) Transcript_37571:368-985(+)
MKTALEAHFRLCPCMLLMKRLVQALFCLRLQGCPNIQLGLCLRTLQMEAPFAMASCRRETNKHRPPQMLALTWGNLALTKSKAPQNYCFLRTPAWTLKENESKDKTKEDKDNECLVAHAVVRCQLQPRKDILERRNARSSVIRAEKPTRSAVLCATTKFSGTKRIPTTTTAISSLPSPEKLMAHCFLATVSRSCLCEQWKIEGGI